MKDEKKTKAQLINELVKMRQQVAELEALVTEPETAEAEQKDLLVEEREQRLLAETLYQVGTVLNSSLNYETVLDCVLEQVGILIPHDAACILLAEDGVARLFRSCGYTQFVTEGFPAALTLNIADTPALRKMQETRQPLVIAAVKNEDRWAYEPGKSWAKSNISVPIYIHNQLVGFLKLDHAKPGFFSESDAHRLQSFANQVAIALRNAQLHDQTRRKITQRVGVIKKERNFVSTVLNTVDVMVMVLNPQGCILRFNRACEETTGYSLDEVRGRYFWDLFLATDEAAKVKQIFETLQTDQSPNDYENHWLTKDGRSRIISWSNNAFLGKGKKIEYIVSTGIDITERRQLEERLVAIHQLGRELNLLRNETDICNIALETASFLLPLRSSGYGVVDEISDELEYYYHPIRGVPKVIELRPPMDPEERYQVLIDHSGEITDVLDDSHQDTASDLAEPLDHVWLTSSMKAGDHIIGVIDVKSQAPIHFTLNDQQLLQTLADQTAVAIENARLHRETHQRVDELTTLSLISQAITSTLNLEATLTIITDHALRLLDATAASVVLHDEVKSDLWFHTASGGVPDFVRGVRLAAGQGIVGWVIQQGEPTLVPDVSQDPRFFGDIDQETGFITRSVICVPLQTEKQTTGAIEVMNKKSGPFTQEDLRLLNWLATPATIAIENARLFEAESSARKQAEILREATTTLTYTLDLDQLLNSILVHLERVVPCDNAYVFLQREDTLYMVAGRGSSQTSGRQFGQQYPADNTVYQAIRNTGHPVILADAQADRRFENWQSVKKARGWMGVPLMAGNKVIGCLTLDSQQVAAYTQVEAALAQAFANQATVAIQNAQLFEQVRAGHSQLQSLSHRLVQVQETERRHIARELHDEAGQALTSLMVGLRLLEREVDDPETVIKHVTQLKSMTNDILENLHRLAMDLRPASLDHLGLTAALRQYIETFSNQNGLKMQFEVVGLDDQPRLPPAVETNVYRIVQEALTNVVRHAKATRIDVLLERRGDQMVAIVEDDGVGFDAEAARRGGRLGLLGMRERAEMLGGTLAVESAVGSNTTIYVEVPYVHSNPNR